MEFEKLTELSETEKVELSRKKLNEGLEYTKNREQEKAKEALEIARLTAEELEKSNSAETRAIAKCILYVMYLKGRGVLADPIKAVELLAEAYKLNYPKDRIFEYMRLGLR